MSAVPFKITTTRFDPAHAEVTLQYLSDELALEAAQPLTLAGSVLGPFCFDRATVAVGHRLEPSADSSDSWRCNLPDPCFWTPITPFLYRLEVEVNGRHYSFHWGIQSVRIQRSHFKIGTDTHAVRGVRLTQPLSGAKAEQLHRAGINLICVPLDDDVFDLARLASTCDSYGIHVLYEVNPDDEPMLWLAENTLVQHISTLGYLLPQAAMQHPQLWHNAMLHLHRQRRDIFIGIQLDTVPLSMVQGHVEFLLAAPPLLEAVENVKMPRLASIRRFDQLQDELPANLAGRVSRVLPVD